MMLVNSGARPQLPLRYVLLVSWTLHCMPGIHIDAEPMHLFTLTFLHKVQMSIHSGPLQLRYIQPGATAEDAYWRWWVPAGFPSRDALLCCSRKRSLIMLQSQGMIIEEIRIFLIFSYNRWFVFPNTLIIMRMSHCRVLMPRMRVTSASSSVIRPPTNTRPSTTLMQAASESSTRWSSEFFTSMKILNFFSTIIIHISVPDASSERSPIVRVPISASINSLLYIYLITYYSLSQHYKCFINIIIDMRVEHARERITTIESHGIYKWKCISRSQFHSLWSAAKYERVVSSVDISIAPSDRWARPVTFSLKIIIYGMFKPGLNNIITFLDIDLWRSMSRIGST